MRQYDERFLFVNLALVFLVVVGFRVNELFLPAIRDPISIAGNIGLVIAAALFGFLGCFIARGISRVSCRVFFWISGILAFLFALVLGLSFHKYMFGPSGYVVEESPNVILITLDTVRADHLGCYGYERNTSPNLDRFASENHLFTNCRTPMPLTSPAHTTLFSGLMANEHGVFTNYISYPDSPDTPCLAEDLRNRGYLTCGFPSTVHMGKDFNFDRGFILYNQSTLIKGPSWLGRYLQFAPFAILSRLDLIRETYLYRNSREANSSFLACLDNALWLKHHIRTPFFVWLHYFDAHSPYQPPEPYWRQYDPDYNGNMTGSMEDIDHINEGYSEDWVPGTMPDGVTPDDIENLRARYDGEISYLDESLGQLFDGLKKRGLWDNTAIIIVADHGEGLFEDGYFGHNYTLKEYEIRTACIIKGPDISCRENADISLVDVARYMREITGLGGSPESPADLGSALTSPSDENREMTDYQRVSMVYLKSHCWIQPPYKLVRSYGMEGQGVSYSLYDYIHDPAERINLFDPSGEPSISMRDSLKNWLDENHADFPDLIKMDTGLEGLDESTLEMLRSLGYIY